MKLTPRVVALVCAVFLLQLAPLGAFASVESIKSPLATSVQTIEINNFERVTPTLFRGAQPSDKGLRQLKAAGVKTIVNFRQSKGEVQEEREFCERNGIKFVHMPMGFLTPDMGTILSFLGIVTNPTNQPVFVHCRQGADRTGTMVGLYRVVVQNWSFERTYDEMRNHGFKTFLVLMKNTVRNFANMSPENRGVATNMLGNTIGNPAN